MNLNMLRNFLQSQFVIDLTHSDDEDYSPPPKSCRFEPITNKLPVTQAPRTSTQDLHSCNVKSQSVSALSSQSTYAQFIALQAKQIQSCSTQTSAILKQTHSVSTQTEVEHWECAVCLESPLERTMWNCSHIFCQQCTEIVTNATPLAACPLCKMIYYQDFKFLKKNCHF